MTNLGGIEVLFSDFFKVSPDVLEKYGAFNISLVADLPLFVDPFLLFNSKKTKYRTLHDQMIDYLRFLRDKSMGGALTPGLIQAWYTFPEIKQNWLGFTLSGNNGRGLGKTFANALNENLGQLFKSFGSEAVTKGSHLEKLCLIGKGVGKDSISDFTNNLIFEFLLEYTQQFAVKHMAKDVRLAQRLAAQHALPMPLTAAAERTFTAAEARGLGDLDFSAILSVIREPDPSA